MFKKINILTLWENLQHILSYKTLLQLLRLQEYHKMKMKFELITITVNQHLSTVSL